MKYLKTICTAILFTIVFQICSAAPQKLSDPADFRRVTAMAARILDRNHFSGIPMTKEFSAKIFDNFINDLDPERLYFSSEDIRSFISERERLGFDLMQGRYGFAFKFYEFYCKRIEEYRNFSRKMLAGPVDFTTDETYTFDRSRSQRVPAKDLHDLWRRKLKHLYLVYKFMEEFDSKKSAAGKKITPAERILQRQRDLGNAISKREKIDILGILINSMAKTYGAHSSYHPPKESEDFDIHMSLSLTGIGATLSSENGYIKIVELVPGGPAARSGKIKVNDRIVRVTQENGEVTDLIDMPVSQAVSFIRGPKGSKVTLEILSGEVGHPTKVLIVRDKINLEESAAKGTVEVVKDPASGKDIKVGIIDLPSFYMNFDGAARGETDARRASTDVRKILTDFRQQQVNAVVFDLRRNGGGSLADAVTLAGLFLPGGSVVQVRNKSGATILADEDPAMFYSGPLVILTSKLSASSAEIFSAALRDSGRAVMAGDSRTFGKSTVLNVESLAPYNALFRRTNAGTLIFESAMFYRINGSSVQQLGVQPDIVLPSITEEMEIGEMYFDNHLPWDCTSPVQYTAVDPSLQRKIPLLRKKSAARIAAAADYQKVMKQIELYRKMRNRKTVSLNEAKRRKQYAEEKVLSEETEKIMDDSRKKNAARKNQDAVLNEAVNIAADLFLLK